MTLGVTVIYSPRPRTVQEVQLQLVNGATVADALRASGLQQQFAQLASTGTCVLGVWGRKARPQQRLRDGDRIEIYRPLQVDPKVARRARFEAQGIRSAGLFAQRRPGAKAGY
ncbi:MAG: RnfH family protein [Betaproteobacteria bacterium]